MKLIAMLMVLNTQRVDKSLHPRQLFGKTGHFCTILENQDSSGVPALHFDRNAREKKELHAGPDFSIKHGLPTVRT